ncbi:Crp/Fnr family transcriptional regulator [Catenovulum sp. SM1970]|uniref:Crp/Fnr family transcriptional regulator n=1 Tax=Marinifaba aquimaris TaxID=2741323 RepID=UPI001573510D|nr:Crp/Fnr family transcriptional regulator [Marinifaba aquimaris]NTS78260.1 Crp/Fnr family transcriptional regulator [Marinifaba aquimaris]
MNFFQFFQQNAKAKVLAKGDVLFHQGEACQQLFYVQSGLLKGFYLDEQGNESIKSFIGDNDIITSVQAVAGSGISSFSLQALEETHVLAIDFALIEAQRMKDLTFANELVGILLKFAMKKERREFELLTLSAEQRFIQLAKEHAIWLDKITQNDLARYLGITPVGLSRIKKRVLGDHE